MFRCSLVVSLLFLLTACGGGSGDGGSAGGGVGTGTVSLCSDTGTDYQTTEYYQGSVYLSEKSRRVVCASSAYARGATGNGIQVAVVDTGVDADHSDINANMVSFTSGSDTVNSDDNASDDHGHGSHVAGIIAAEKNDSGMHGIAYDADIYAFKAFNSSGSATDTSTGTAFGLIEAIAAIDIVNNSWGTNVDCSSASQCRSLVGTTTYDNWEDMAQLSTPKINVLQQVMTQKHSQV